MTNFPSEVLPTGDQTYRLVVAASQLKTKQFVWVIVDESNRGLRVQASEQTFRSMEDAYNAGQGALKYWRAKAMRAQVKALLAPPAAPKDRTKGPTPFRP
jgi:hypothetical protein